MTSFSSILSSIGQKPQAPQQASATQSKQTQSGSDIRKLTTATNGVKLSPNNTAAGVKRKSEEPESGSRAKFAKSEPGHSIPKTASAGSSSRFQLSAKGPSSGRPSASLQNSAPRTGAPQSKRPVQNATSRPAAKAGSTSSPTPPSTANGAPPAKRGFASIMERAKAAQEAAKTTPTTTIKHKSAETLSRRERLRMMEEAKAQQKGTKRSKPDQAARSRSQTPVTTTKLGAAPTSYQGTMKKKAEPLAYKGTMRKVEPGEVKEKAKTKGQPQDKYGGYASWSDLDDAEEEEEEEDDYASDVSSDMEGGFDDVEEEETLALRAAKKEDAQALAEEEAHRKEKLARKRRLEQLSKNAAAKRKY